MAALEFPIPLGAVSSPAAGSWRSLFPEFNTCPDWLAQSRLDQAAVQIDPTIWGNRSGEGQAYLAAHLLALSPSGQFSRLQSEKGKTTYGTYYDLMVVQVAGLIFRVI